MTALVVDDGSAPGPPSIMTRARAYETSSPAGA